MTKLIVAFHSFANAPRSEAILMGFPSVVQVFYLFEVVTLFAILIKSISGALFKGKGKVRGWGLYSTTAYGLLYS
jgi:hypothetical protein